MIELIRLRVLRYDDEAKATDCVFLFAKMLFKTTKPNQIETKRCERDFLFKYVWYIYRRERTTQFK